MFKKVKWNPDLISIKYKNISGLQRHHQKTHKGKVIKKFQCGSGFRMYFQCKVSGVTEKFIGWII